MKTHKDGQIHKTAFRQADSGSCSREGQLEPQEEQSREFKFGLSLSQMTPKGSATSISVFNLTVMHYW